MKGGNKRVMFSAVGRSLYLDLPLSQTIIDYAQQNSGIAGTIAPVVDVYRQGGAITEFSQADRFRVVDDFRAPGQEAKRIEMDVSSQLYFCKNRALKAGVTLEDRVNADPVYFAKLIDGRAMMVTDKLMLNWERRVSLQVTSTSNVGSSAAVASLWSTPEGDGNPSLDINVAIDNVRYATGYRPNRIIFGPKAWDAYRRHKNVRNVIYGTNNGGGYPTTQQVATLHEVDRVDIAGTFFNSTNEGQTASISPMWDAHVLVCYVPLVASIDRPSFMYSYRLAGPGVPNMQVERHPYDAKTKTDDVEVGYYQDEKITGSKFGFLVQSCV